MNKQDKLIISILGGVLALAGAIKLFFLTDAMLTLSILSIVAGNMLYIAFHPNIKD